MNVYWIRRDLRVHDNPALHAASDAKSGVLAVYLLCESAWRRHDVGANQVQWILAHLAAMQTVLAERNIPLKIMAIDRLNQSATAITKLCQSHKIDAVYWNQQYQWDELQRDQRCEASLKALHIPVHTYHDQTILHPGAVQTKQGRCYTVFTPYKKSFYAHISRHGVPAALARPKKQPLLSMQSDVVPKSLSSFACTINFPSGVGEKAALHQLDLFCERSILEYKKYRDVPSLDATSRLSPYLAIGVLSPRQCLASLFAQHNQSPGGLPQGPRCWLDELLWREFYKNILVFFPHVCRGQAYQTRFTQLSWANNQSHWHAWRHGQTGIPIVDAAMRQLKQCGWMHNRLRMVVAMFLSKNLDIDWRWGERYFSMHLFDYDFSANNGGWQWSSSTGTDAAPYFRVMNPVTQSQRFDPEGDFIRQYVPELSHLDARSIHCPGSDQRADYHQPVVDLKVTRQRAIDKFKQVRSA